MEQEMLVVGHSLMFTTDSELYHDVYKAQIEEIYPDHIDLNIPLHKGYLLLIPIGTNLRILHPGTNQVYVAMVISRQTIEKTWSISIPRPEEKGRKSKVIAVGSGKGGVGKTTLSINLGLAMLRLDQRVVILDADIGMANVEILLKLNASRNLTDVINGHCSIQDIVTEAPGGLQIIPGSSGISSLTNLNPIQFNRVVSSFIELEGQFDIFIVDTGAGISEQILKFLEAADQVALVTTPEPHALMDTYALAKSLAYRNETIDPYLVINRSESQEEALRCLKLFHRASAQYLKKQPRMLGWISDDKKVFKSLKNQTPLLLSHPKSEFAQQVMYMAQELLGQKVEQRKASGITAFINKVGKRFR